MSWSSIESVAKKNLYKKGISNKVHESLIIEKANRLIIDLFTKEAENIAPAIYWSDSKLTIAVLSDSLYQEISSQEEQFIKILNSRFDGKVVNKIKYLI